MKKKQATKMNPEVLAKHRKKIRDKLECGYSTVQSIVATLASLGVPLNEAVITTSYMPYSDGEYPVIEYERDETDDEVEKRLAKKTSDAKLVHQYELEQYKRLSKKFGKV